jgi:hypothetical protein
MALVPAGAGAQSVFVVGAPGTIFDGDVVELDVYFGSIANPETVSLFLPDGYELVRLTNTDAVGGVIFASASPPAGCVKSGNFYDCPPTASGLDPTVTLDVAPYPGGLPAAVQRITLSNPTTMAFWQQPYRAFVRLKLPACPVPRMILTYAGTNYPASVAESAELCSAPVIPTRVVLTPAGGAAVAARGNTTGFDVDVQAEISTGVLRAVTEDKDDPAVRSRLLHCRRTTLDPSPGPCDSGAFPTFAAVSVISGSPLRLHVVAVDAADPVAGDAELSVTLGGAQPLSATLPITVEQPASSLKPSASPGTSVTQPGRVDLSITEVLNALGGHEPRRATWSVASVTPTALDATARAWLDPAAATVTVPTLPPEAVTLQLTATHTNPAGAPVTTAPLSLTVARAASGCSIIADNPTMPPGGSTALHIARGDGASTTGLTATWSIDTGGGTITADAVDSTRATYGAPGAQAKVTVRATLAPSDVCTESRLTLPLSVAIAASCSIQVDPPRIGPAGTSSLRIVRSDGASTQGLVASWVAEDGGGTVIPDAQVAAHATYVAPPDPTHATVRADISPGAVCPEASLTAAVDVVQDVSVSLAFTRPRVEAGQAARAEAKIENLTNPQAPLTGLVLFLEVPASLAVVEAVPRVDGHTAVRALGAVKATAWSFDLDASSRHLADLSMLARTARGCGPVKVRATLHRDAGGPAIAAAEASIVVGCDRELTEATVFGRVFDDRNGDGVQQEGEPGVPGALVACAAGIWAVTDRNGDYHLPRLPVGRHAFKLDAGSLPAGAQVREARREVTLTPGAFVRVSFPVRVPSLALGSPLLFVATGSGLAAGAGGLVYRARFTVPTGGELWAQRGAERVTASTEADGARVLALPVDAAGEHWLVGLRAGDGRVWLWSFGVHVYRRSDGSRLVIPRGPRPLAALALPQATTAGGRAVISAELAEALTVTLEAPGSARCTLAGGPGPAECELTSKESLAVLTASLDPPIDAGGDDPPLLVTTLTLASRPSSHFVVARGEAALTRIGTGDAPLGDGGGEVFYRGRLEGGALVTAGADLAARDLLLGDDGRLRSWGSIASRLVGHDPRKVFRDLDPETYYPTYGDASVSVDEREAGGRFFARVQYGQSYAKWGGINTGVSDAEVGQYVRSLYGFGSQLAVGSPADGVSLRAVAFGAKPDSVPVRDELVVTGGSLYYLSRHDLVEGSLRVALELLDEVSGLPTRVVPLIEGADYEADYLGGRLTLDAALAARTFGRSLTSFDAGGGRARLVVDYEVVAGGASVRDVSTGGRAVVRLGPVSVGGTAVGEMASEGSGGPSRYTLLGATARLDLGPELRLRAELARSEGSSRDAARSWDGGLSWTPVTGVDRPAGQAAVVELQSDLGWVTAGAYGKVVEPGFTDSRTALGQDLRQLGARVAAEPVARTKVWAEVDRRDLGHDGAARTRRDLAILGASQVIGVIDVAVESRLADGASYTERAVVAAAEVGVRPAADVRVSMRRRQVLSGEGPDTASTTLLGVSWTAGKLTAGAEGGATDAGRGFGRVQASVPLVDGIELYGAYLAQSHLAAEPGALGRPAQDGLLVGGRRRLGDGSLLYSEQRLSVDGSERMLTRSVGVETMVLGRVGLLLAYERGRLGTEESAPALTRDSGSVGVLWQGERVALRLGVDARRDDGPLAPGAPAQTVTQLGANGRLELHLTEALTLAGGGRGATTTGGPADRQSWEASVGFAYRSRTTERLSLFGRYAMRRDAQGIALTTTDVPATSTTQLSHLAALAVLINVIGPLDLGPKLYWRTTTAAAGPDSVSDQALIVALRADWHLTGTFDASLEARSCEAPGSGLARSAGALLEASALVLDWLRLGAGYNLSRIATDGVRCDEPGARGAFLRAEVVY